MKRDVQVEVVPITDLQPDPSNANAGTERGLSMLEDSLQQLGAGRSVLADRHGVLMAGNKTHQRAVELGFEEAVVVHTDGRQLVVVQRDDLDLETDPRARRMAIVDNRVGEVDLQWSPEMLAAIAAEQPEALAGLWTDDELRALMAATPGEEVEAPEAQIDRAAELQEKWGAARGQVWEIPSKSVPGKSHELMCGDSTSVEDVARLMGGERVALVVTDPPYGVEYADKNAFLNTIAPGNRIQTHIEGDHGTKEETQDLWRAAFREMAAVMAPGAVVYCFMPQGGDQMMMMMMMMGAGIEPRHELIWLKNNHVLGRVDYAYKHEPILYAWKDGGHKFYGDFQTSILEFPKPQKSDLHPTTKPVELIGRLVCNSSKAGELTYDPFLGSGTTMVAAEQTGRICYGMEISEAYTAVALERMAGMGLSPRLSS